MENHEFTYVSLFSGIGGFEQALNKHGGKCLMASEIDKFANKSYRALYGHETVGDITKVAAEDVPDHDVLVGGFPCQAFSVAGKRLGFEDTRGTLFFEVARIAKEKRPKAMLLENVKGLVGHDKGKTLDTIIKTLNDIGYTIDFNVLNSKHYGVPQNRERIFIVALRDDLINTNDWKIEGSGVVAKGKRRIGELPQVKTFNFNWNQKNEVTTRLRDILEPVVEERFYLSKEKTSKLVAQLEKNCTSTLENEIPNMLGHVDLKGHDAIKRVYDPAAISPTLTTMGGGHREPKIAVVKSLGNTNPSGNGMNGQVYDIDGGLAPTLTTNKGEGNRITSSPEYRIRKLTPLECFRLQGFSDEVFDKLKYYTSDEAKEIIANQYKGRDFAESERLERMSNSQLYKQAGNAVTVNVIEDLIIRLNEYIK